MERLVIKQVIRELPEVPLSQNARGGESFVGIENGALYELTKRRAISANGSPLIYISLNIKWRNREKREGLIEEFEAALGRPERPITKIHPGGEMEEIYVWLTRSLTLVR